MNWFGTIDIYCERTNAGFWNEPINMITSLIFFAAAWHLYQVYTEKGRHDVQGRRIIVLIALMGAGSMLFHMFANALSLLADIIPIAVFVFYYLWVALQRFLHLPARQIYLALAALAASVIGVSYVPEPYSFNNSIVYFPCIAALLLIAHRLKALKHEATAVFFIAATWFGISLFFRSIDMSFCSILFVGTHFLWHLCNGVVVYILAKAVIERPALTLR